MASARRARSRSKTARTLRRRSGGCLRRRSSSRRSSLLYRGAREGPVARSRGSEKRWMCARRSGEPCGCQALLAAARLANRSGAAETPRWRHCQRDQAPHGRWRAVCSHVRAGPAASGGGRARRSLNTQAGGSAAWRPCSPSYRRWMASTWVWSSARATRSARATFLINGERSAQGLPPLSWCSVLAHTR